MFVVEIRMPAGGGPPVMHRHAPSEVYFILEGRFAFYIGGPGPDTRLVVASAGDVVPLRGGTPHTIRNESDADAVAIVVHAPGGPMEGFSHAAAELAAAGVANMDQVLALGEEHGIEMLGPVPAELTHT